jgi:hypothetical protein
MRDALYLASLSSHALARHAFVKHVCGNQVKAAIYSLVLLDHPSTLRTWCFFVCVAAAVGLALLSLALCLINSNRLRPEIKLT